MNKNSQQGEKDMVSEAVAMFIATGTKSQVTCVGSNEVEGS